jgi:holo-[acyl-carrier protein] synthase
VIVGLGTDLVDVARFRSALERRAGIAERLFTDGEREYGMEQHDPAESLAARFAAKEAVMKALGVGLGDFEFRDVEVLRADSGQPALALTGRARELAQGHGVVAWQVSLSHTATTALAVVIAIGA